jgi:perosamine synthetase
MYLKIVSDIKNALNLLNKKKKNSLHEPFFDKIDFYYLNQCLKSSYVSTAGPFISKFENKISKFTKSQNVIAVVNGTVALEICLRVLGAKINEEILIPTLTFVGTANSVVHAGCVPHFIDSEKESLGIDINKLEEYLKKNTKIIKGKLINIKTKRVIFGIIPVHVFGLMNNIEKLIILAKRYKLKVIEDSAESLGTFYKKKHSGTFGDLGVISFNGNKIITTGGGGAILCKSNFLAKKIRHFITTAKKKHPWQFLHDKIGWNYRMPNINASLGYSQIKKIKKILFMKRNISLKYQDYFKHNKNINYIRESNKCRSNYWLNAVYIKNINLTTREKILKLLNNNNIFCRPVWTLLHKLPMFKKNPRSNLNNSIKIEKELICLPSSPYLGSLNK